MPETCTHFSRSDHAQMKTVNGEPDRHVTSGGNLGARHGSRCPSTSTFFDAEEMRKKESIFSPGESDTPKKKSHFLKGFFRSGI